MGVQYPEILLDAAAILAKELERRGMAPEMASDVAFSAVEELRSKWGGADVYIPQAQYLELSSKYAEIYERWLAGEQVPELARSFGYSFQWIRQVVRTARLQRRQKAKARPLFEEAI